jgi:hypothetical protein
LGITRIKLNYMVFRLGFHWPRCFWKTIGDLFLQGHIAYTVHSAHCII